MPEYRADEWNSYKAPLHIPLSPREMVDIWVSCTKEVTVSGVSNGQATVLKAGTEFRFRGQVKGYTRLVIKGTGKTPFGARVRHSALQNGEVISDERPPVVDLPEPSNLVLKMRQIARAHHNSSRMPVLEPDDMPSFGRYEFDDDQDVLFEEEEALARHEAEKKAKAEVKQKAEETKARKDAEVTEAGKPEKPPQATETPGKPQPVPEVPPPAKAAE